MSSLVSRNTMEDAELRNRFNFAGAPSWAVETPPEGGERSSGTDNRSSGGQDADQGKLKDQSTASFVPGFDRTCRICLAGAEDGNCAFAMLRSSQAD